MKYQVLFSLKNNEKIFMTVVCCYKMLLLSPALSAHSLYFQENKFLRIKFASLWK